MKKTILIAIACLLLVPVLAFGQVYQQSCSSCHASMAKEPVFLKGTPPVDLLSALSTPCYDYGKVLEEWYYVEELFVASERLAHYLESKRMHATAQLKSLSAARDKYRIMLMEPVTSLTEFKAKTGALRYEIGKSYRDLKAASNGIRGKNVFGVLVLGALVILFMVVAGWARSSGKGIVHPSREHEEEKPEPAQKEAVES